MSESKKVFLEKRALEPIPTGERQHWMSVTLIQAGFMISATSLWTGSIMAAGMSLWNTVIAAVIGYVIIVAICTVQGIMGSDLGVPSIVAATSSFGDRGSQWLISSVCAICTIGWFAINANICGAAFSGLLSASFGISFPIPASVILWGVVMFVTAAIGFNGLKVLNVIAVPLMVAVSVVGLYMALSGKGLDVLKDYVPTGEAMSLLTGIDMVIGGFIVGAVLSADYTRYQKTRMDVLRSSFFGIFPIGVGLLWVGGVLAIVAGTEDLTKIFIGLGIPFLGMLSLILSTWPANAANAYSAGLDVMKVFNITDRKRPMVTVICGLAGTIIGSFQIIHYFENFLIILGVIIAPFAGVMIADYWIINKGKAANWAPVKNINWPGMISLALGVLTSFLIKVGIAGLNGIIVSMIAYVILYRIMPKPEKLNVAELE
ncbi:MAG: cytosine permease [Anaerovoracaceae bacterium]|jgi:cytosine permease